MKFTGLVYEVQRLRSTSLKMCVIQTHCISSKCQDIKKRQWKILSCLLEKREAKQGLDDGHHLDQKKIVVSMSKRSL